MSDTYEPENEVDAAVHAANHPEPAAAEAPSSADAAPEAPEESQEAPAWAAKWGTSDPAVAVEKAHKAWEEAQHHISSTRRAEDQPAQQQAPVDPMSFLPPQIDEATFKRIEASAERDPQGTALWAIENQQMLGPQITGAILRNWSDQDFLGFQQWQMQQVLSAQQQHTQQQWAPIEAHTYQQISNSAVAEAGHGIPDFEDYKPKILAAIEENAYIAQHVSGVANDPQQLAKAIRDLYGWVKGNEYVQQLGQQPPQGQQAAAVDSQKNKARSERRSTATPNDGSSRDAQVQDLIMNARP